MTKKTPLSAVTTNRDTIHHFFASSLGRWKVSYDIASLIATMKKDDLPFNVWIVPGEIDRPYEINGFAPVVEDAKWLIFYGKANAPSTKKALDRMAQPWNDTEESPA